MTPTGPVTHYTLGEVAQLFRVTRQTARGWLRGRKIPPPVRAVRRPPFAADRVHAHVEQLRAVATAGVIR